MITITRYRSIFSCLLFLTVVLLAGCRDNAAENHRMNRAEALIESAPDSAMLILDSVSSASLTTKKDKARYALLKSMALDKNYIDTTTFDVLQPAIDYYLKKGTPDEKLRTLYYQGRIYQNSQNKDEDAMKCFIEGIDLKNISDSLTLARVYYAQSLLFKKQNLIESYIKSSLSAAEIWKSIGYSNFEFTCLTQAINGYILMNQRYDAERLFEYADALNNRRTSIDPSYLHSKIIFNLDYSPVSTCLPLLNSIRENILDSIQDSAWKEELTLDLASGYQRINQNDRAENILNGLDKVDDNRLLKYLVIKAEVEKAKGQYLRALNTTDEIIHISDSINSEVFSQEIMSVEKRYLLEKEVMMAKEKKYISNLIGVIMFLSLVVTVFISNMVIKKVTNRNKRLQKDNSDLNARSHFLSGENKRLIVERNNFSQQNTDLRDQNDALACENNRIVEESERLSQLLAVEKKISEALKDRDRKGTSILTGYFASKITSDKRFAKEFSQLDKDIQKNKRGFLDHLREILDSTYPNFKAMVAQGDFRQIEIDFLCLYALGLNGQEVGTYMDIKRHYVISSEIRKKLRLDSTHTNLSLYIQSILK